jgi:hypothetical protein
VLQIMSNINYEIIIAGFIASLPTLIANGYGALKARSDAKRESLTTEHTVKKIDTEAADTLTDISLSLIQPLKDENERLKDALASCQIEKASKLVDIEALWKGARVLYNQLKDLQEVPNYELPPFPQNGTITKPLKKN